MRSINKLGSNSGQLRRLSSSSSVSWISPLKLAESKSKSLQKPDSPEEPKLEIIPPQRPTFIVHKEAAEMIRKEKDPQRALDIFNAAGNQPKFRHNNETYSAIFDKLCVAKKFKAVDALLSNMMYVCSRFHEFLFVSLMTHFSRASRYQRVLDMFDSISVVCRTTPSPKALSTCLNLLVEAGETDLARRLLVRAETVHGFTPNTCIFNILMKRHCRNGEFGFASELFAEMRKSKRSYPNLITYSTLIQGLSRNGLFKEAMEVFEEMIAEEKIAPDAITYNVMMQGFCQAGGADKACKIAEFMKRNGFEPHLSNYKAIFEGVCKLGLGREAEQVLAEMIRLGFKPYIVTYAAIIAAYCQGGNVDRALELIEEMKERGCRPNVVTYNIVLGGFCREGRLEEAFELIKKFPIGKIRLDKVSYRTVLHAMNQSGELRRALDLLDLMIQREFVPHLLNFNDLLVLLCDAEMVDDAVAALFGLMNSGFKPETESWVCLVELVARKRKLLYVFQLIDELV